MSAKAIDNFPKHDRLDHPNPLIEGIVLASNEAEMLGFIANNPFLDKRWLSQHQDLDLFRAYLSHVVVPTNTVLKIGIDIHKAFKISAYQQNPLVHKNRISYFSPSQSTTTLSATQTTHCGVVTVGLTGLGKTFLLVAALNTIPQTVKRTDLAGLSSVTQVTWIRIDMTSIASIEALAEQIIRAIDDALSAEGKVYESTLAGARAASVKMERALRLMQTHFVSILAVDEIQANNFSRPDSESIRFWLLRIANQKISVIFSGNPLGFVLHAPKKETTEARYATQQLRRLFASNRTRLDPAESIYDPDWDRLIRTLATCHLDGSRDPFNADLEALKLQLTGGFPDFYVALHCELEKIRVARPGCEIKQETIKKAAEASSLIQVMQPLISAFATCDAIALRKCTDVDHDYYLKKWGLSADPSSNPEPQRVATPASDSPQPPEVDPVKAIEGDRKGIERRQEKKRAKAKAPASSIKTEVLEHHLDQLNSLIITGASNDAEE